MGTFGTVTNKSYDKDDITLKRQSCHHCSSTLPLKNLSVKGRVALTLKALSQQELGQSAPRHEHTKQRGVLELGLRLLYNSSIKKILNTSLKPRQKEKKNAQGAQHSICTQCWYRHTHRAHTNTCNNICPALARKSNYRCVFNSFCTFDKINV